MADHEERLLMLIDDEPAQSRLVTALAARDGWREQCAALDMQGRGTGCQGEEDGARHRATLWVDGTDQECVLSVNSWAYGCLPGTQAPADLSSGMKLVCLRP